MMINLHKDEGELYFKANKYDASRVKSAYVLFLFGLAFLAITICSKSSFLYPINDAPDANAYMTMGKSIWRGYVPYRDLYDHKGPFLYVIHAIGSLVSRTSFLGIYIFEIIACFFFLFYFYKALRLYLNEKCILMMPIIAAFVYASGAFINGDSPEEFSLPFLMYGLYEGIRIARSERFPDNKIALVIGITSGCVFWMKFTMVAFYVGWLIIPLYLAITRKLGKQLLKMIAFIALGVFISTIPYIIYFGINGAISDLFGVYFYDNIFRYTEESYTNPILNIILNSYNGFAYTYIDLIPFYFVFALGLLWTWISDSKRCVVFYLSCLLIMHFVSYGGGRSFHHYTLLYLILSLPGWVACYHIISVFLDLRGIKLRLVAPLCSIMCGIGVIIMVGFGANIHLLGTSRDEHPLYQIKSMIDSDDSYNGKILNYKCVDLGLYTVLDIYPICRYYYIPNMIDSVGIDEQDTILMQRDDISYVIAQHKENPQGYELVYYKKFRIENWLSEYCLYRKKLNASSKGEIADFGRCDTRYCSAIG